MKALVSAAALVAASAEAAVPSDFQDTLIVALGQPTALAFTPDGRLLISRQGGTLRVYQGGTLLATPALTLANVCSNSERGLLGVAVDPDFAGTGFVYLYYTVNKSGTCWNRVSRFVLPAGSVIDPASEVVLLDNIRSTAGNHNAGDLSFGKDGYLYVSVGDGGCDYAGDSGCAGANDAARDVNTLLGKILRVTRDGGVPSDNPWLGEGTASCRTSDAPASTKCQETFAWGLRNPFRFAMDPGALGVRFFINDVGQGSWEEIDLGEKGADYGWNCREGAHANPSAGPKCSPAPPGMVDPLFEYPHSGGCGSITGGAFLPTGFWPSGFDGSYFYSDYNCGTIFRLVSSGGTYSSSSFATGLGSSSAVHLLFGPYGGGLGLYYTNYAGGGEVRVVHYTGSANRSPQAQVSADPLSGAPPLLVTFDATGSSDPDGDPLTYLWSFGDGSPEVETVTVTTTHTYLAGGAYTASLRAKDPSGALSDPVAAVINVANTPPAPTILAPGSGDTFRVGQPVTLVGGASDAEDGALPDGQLTWNVLLHHDAHTHPFLTDVVGNNVPFVAPTPEDLAACQTSFLEIRLTATDSAGAQATVAQDFNPHKVAVILETSPSGLTLEVNGAPFVAPVTLTSWESYDLSVNAPDQSKGGAPYTFLFWSDGGARAHTFNTPPVPVTLGAAFSAPAPVPEAVPFLAVSSGHEKNHVEWLNPPGPSFGSTTLVFRTDRFAATPADGTVLFAGGAAGAKTPFDHTSLADGTTYYYSAFVNLSGGGLSAGRFAKGRPFDTTTGPVKWAYSTGATALAPPGVGAHVLGVSNDRVVHAMLRGAGGGSWPAGFTPRLLGAAVQTRPPLVDAGLVSGHPNLAFLAAQDGVVYAVDADTGALVWQSPTLGESLQGAVAGGFTAYGFFTDRLFIGTRNSSGPNRFYALDPRTGFPFGVPYEGTEGGGIGVVNGGAAVDYASSRVLFASRAAAAGAHTLWCLEATPSGFLYRWSQPIGDVDGSPVVRGARVYVGGNDGVVHAFDKMTGVEAWSYDTGSEPIKGFLFPDRTGKDLFFATTGFVYGLSDDGPSASSLFTPLAAGAPSIVLFRPAEGGAPARLYFGAGDQRLHELDLSSSPPTERSVLLGGVPAVIGAPSYDTGLGLIYVGSDAGVVYAVTTPLP
jgi:glucose/arabinose dehydrogenase/outer membrane protein assembly factor BamB